MRNTVVWDWDVGTLAEWATVFATVAAVVAASVFASRANRSARLAADAASKSNEISRDLLRLETQRENRTNEELARQRVASERAEQADRVAVWLDPAQFMGVVRWLVINSGPLPIYEVDLELVDPSSGTVVFVARVDVIPPGQEPQRQAGSTGGDLKAKALLAEASWLPNWVNVYRAAVSFDDAAGRRWKRNHKGQLSKIAEPREASSAD